MKILVVSLLRVGDVVSTLPALAHLRAVHPTAQIDILLNRSVEPAAGLMASVDQVFYFERDFLQAGLVDAQRPLFEPYDFLKSFVRDIQSQKYDLVVNMTHNRLSGWLCGLLQGTRVIGLSLGPNGQVSFGSNWFKYLNLQVDAEDEWAFNHVDIFLGAVGGFSRSSPNQLPESSHDLISSSLVCETRSGAEEVENLTELMASWSSESCTVVALQISTSDPKKDLGDEKWGSLLDRLLSARDSLRFVVLGAPFEISRVMRFIDRRADDLWRSRVVPGLSSLEALPTLLDCSDAILTGDTAVKHLACALSLPVFEIAVGSADPHRTGAWRAGDVIVQTTELCSPCAHSQACHREQHFCAIHIELNELQRICLRFLDGAKSPEGIQMASLALARQASSLRTFQVWRGQRVSHLIRCDVQLTEAELFRLIDRYSRFVAVERLQASGGTRLSNELVDEIDRLLSSAQNGVGDQELAYMLSALRERVEIVDEQFAIIEKAYQPASRALRGVSAESPKNLDRVQSEIKALRSVIDRCLAAMSQVAISTAFSEVLASLTEEGTRPLSPFGFLRKVKETLSDSKSRIQILRELTLKLEERSLDRSENYAAKTIYSSSSGRQH